MSWTSTGGGDHLGEDWNISSGIIAGDHTNVGNLIASHSFKVDAIVRSLNIRCVRTDFSDNVSVEASQLADFSQTANPNGPTIVIDCIHKCSIFLVDSQGLDDFDAGPGSPDTADNGVNGNPGAAGADAQAIDCAPNCLSGNFNAAGNGSNGGNATHGEDGSTYIPSYANGPDSGDVTLKGAKVAFASIHTAGKAGTSAENTNASNGGNGGTGGAGGAGGSGAGICCCPETTGGGLPDTTGAGDGGDGGAGGNGGDGGLPYASGNTGGNGGNGGNLTIYYSDTLHYSQEFSPELFRGGGGGRGTNYGGAGGTGGAGGAGGDADSAWTFICGPPNYNAKFVGAGGVGTGGGQGSDGIDYSTSGFMGQSGSDGIDGTYTSDDIVIYNPGITYQRGGHYLKRIRFNRLA